MSASNPAVPEPTHIGKFEIVQKLGAGAMGTVYKAKDPELRRLVAVKTIRLEGLAASQQSLDDLLARFKREAQVAAGLRHPNIVTIHEIGSLPGNSYLVMEFVDGVGLDRVIKGSGKMSVERAAAIGAQVADALAFAQKQNVVHRDIKPANIMIEPGDHVKVTDFGIAKFVTADTVDNLTATGSLLGTPSYMSPEQARGATIDGRSDLFSLGCILYEMVSGQRAFRGESITGLLFKIITEEPPSLRELDPTVSDEMIRIIAKALSKAPETRYQSGRELADDLLAVTRPGFVPTLRAAEVPTLPPDAPPGDVPTVSSPPTARPEPTFSSAATAARPGATSSTQPGPGGAPPVPPTILTPATSAPPPVPPRPKSPATARPAPRPAATPARRQGAGAGLIVGLGGAALLGLALIVGGGWFLFGRTAPTPAPPPDGAPATESLAPGEPATPQSNVASPAEAAPAPEAGLSTTTAPPAPSVAQPSARAGAGVVAGIQPIAAPPPSRPVPPVDTATSSVAAEPSGAEYSHLDELPPETPDGRAAGEALAQKYRSGGSTGYPAARLRARARVPAGLTLAERPAAATLLYLHTSQEAFHRKNGRYGSLRELADAGLFVLDVRFDAEGFRRAPRHAPRGGPPAAYDFRVQTEADGFRADATPVGPIGRALMVDDSGFVRFPD